MLEPYRKEIEADFKLLNERFSQLSTADSDVIGRVLRAHLVVESFLDTFLADHYQIEDVD